MAFSREQARRQKALALLGRDGHPFAVTVDDPTRTRISWP
jgi:hypothetical protein